MCAGEPRVGSSCSSACAPAAEIDRGARERVVHRHDGVAVARDPAPVAERAVERLAERERRVLGGVVVARLEVARAFERRGRSPRGTRAARGSGRRARRRSRRARGSRRRARAAPRAASRRSREACAHAPAAAARRPATAGRAVARAPRRARRRRRASRTETRIASGYARTTMPLPQQRVAERQRRRRPGTYRKFVCDSSGASPSARSDAASRSRSSITGATSGGSASAAEGERRRERRDRRRRLPGIQLVGDVARRERVADARTGEREQLRERAQHDDAVVDAARAPSRRCTRSTPRRRRAAARRAAGRARPSGCSGGRRTSATGSSSPTSAPGELRGDAIERIRRRRRDRDRVARTRRTRVRKEDQVVGARAEHDVLRLDAVVVGDRARAARGSRRPGSR